MRCHIVLPQEKVGKIDHLLSTCVLVGLTDIQRFSLHLLLVSFGHYRPLPASQVTGRKEMEARAHSKSRITPNTECVTIFYKISESVQ